ncbi:MAG: ABC transporter permease [Acidimicrobiales bacterium]
MIAVLLLAADAPLRDFFTSAVLLATLASAIRLATPYLLASLGETLGQKSGVLNLGVEGVMLLGAFVGYWTVLETKNAWLGAGAGLLVGAVMGLVYAVITVNMQAEQGISGIGIFLFGLGASELLFSEVVGTPLPLGAKFDPVALPLLSKIPKVGDVLFNQNVVVYFGVAMVFVMTWVLNNTSFGLNVRAVGETPEAADSLGVSVAKIRYTTIIIANMFAGLAGAALALELNIFQNNLTNGIGFIAVALVYFGGWKPSGVLYGSLLYGLVTATVNQLKTLGIVSGAAASLATTAPAVLTVLALALIARRAANPPAALTVPFTRGH